VATAPFITGSAASSGVIRGAANAEAGIARRSERRARSLADTINIEMLSY
jgi:hypothetical protein